MLLEEEGEMVMVEELEELLPQSAPPSQEEEVEVEVVLANAHAKQKSHCMLQHRLVEVHTC